MDVEEGALPVATTLVIGRAEAARIATSGDYVQRMAKLNLADRQIPIRVGFDQATLAQPDLLAQLRVPGARGAVPLAAPSNRDTCKDGVWLDKVTGWVRWGNLKKWDGAQCTGGLPRPPLNGATRWPPGEPRILRCPADGFPQWDNPPHDDYL